MKVPIAALAILLAGCDVIEKERPEVSSAPTPIPNRLQGTTLDRRPYKTSAIHDETSNGYMNPLSQPARRDRTKSTYR